MIYWYRDHYVWNSWVGAYRLPRALDFWWRRLAYRKRVRR